MNAETLNAYFHRIQLDEIQENSLENLQILVKYHTREIPFENLNPLLNIPVKLDLDSLIQKIIFDGRGGYCFEQNLLFMEVLKTMGYQVEPLAARVTISGETMNARTHMFLLVQIEDSQYLTDVGFGGMTPTEPILFEPDRIQKTPHTTYRITKDKDEFSFEYLKDTHWKSLYVFDLQKQFPVDFQMANWYTSTHPKSHFRHQLSVALAGEGKRFGLHDNKLSVYYKDGKTEEKIMTTPTEIIEVLNQIFKLTLKNLPGLHVRLEDII